MAGQMAGQRVVLAGLRRWAAGSPADEAAVELLQTAFGGRLCHPVWPWVRPCARTGWYCLDGTQLTTRADLVTVLDVAAGLVDGTPITGPGRVALLPGREAIAVTTALARAGRTLQPTSTTRTARPALITDRRVA